MWLILQSDRPDDWVIATGKTTSVRDFVVSAFQFIGVELNFIGHGVDEIAVVKSSSNENFKLETGKEVLKIDPRYFRPTEVDLLIGDSSKARSELGWEPEYDLKDLVTDMMKHDLALASIEKSAPQS